MSLTNFLLAWQRSPDEYYHGTDEKKLADEIIVEGLQGRPEQGKNYFAPIKDRVYLTQELSYAIIYAIGGNMLGSDLSDSLIPQYGQFAYLFVVRQQDLNNDLIPDEDSIGQMVWDFYMEKNGKEVYHDFDYSKVDKTSLGIRLLNWAENNLTPRQKHEVKVFMNDEAILSHIGKKAIKTLDKGVLDTILQVGGINVSQGGPVMPSQCWQFDRNLCPQLQKDGSNFFDLATLYWRRND